ncbi:hypothetical protein GALL_274210 [mine drainage metagenome]|uniref:Uncharacterized protein n=1 Tax=mine drainage metagenome TaxID=410659 RepID=A0A1J5RMD8_9ZZZZ
MLPQEIFKSFRGVADQSGVLFYYTGSFSQSIVAAIGDTLKQRLEGVGASNGARRKVFSSFIEMAQNILHYSAELPNHEDGVPLKQGALAVGREGEKFFVVCGNPVRAEDVPRLQEKLEPLRRMSLDEIKSAYRARLRNDAHEADTISKGAGLGFLTVARDATEPIEYSIVYAAKAGAAIGRVDLYLKAII